MRNTQVCVIAYVCNPAFSSEPGNSAQWVIAYRRAGAHVTVVSRDEKPVDNRFADIEWFRIPTPMVPKLVRRSRFGVYWAYVIWQRTANRSIPSNATRVHHVSWAGFTLGSRINPGRRLLIFGPMGGGQLPRLSTRWTSLTSSAILAELVRASAILCRRRFGFSRFRMANRILICANPEVANKLERRNIPSHVDVAVGLNGKTEVERISPIKQILWVGRFFDIKDPKLAVTIAHRFLSHQPDFVLTMLGDGPLLDSCRRLAVKLGIADRVRFLGWVSQEQVERYLSQSWCLLITSFRESFSAQIVDALRMNCPVVSVRLPGSPEMSIGGLHLVDELPARSLVDRYVEALQGMSQFETRMTACEAITDSLRHFNWDAKLERLNNYLSAQSLEFNKGKERAGPHS